MSQGKWLLSAGHYHLFHIVAPIVARGRGYFEQEGAGECDFLFSGSDSQTIDGMKEGKYQVGLDPKPFLLCRAKAQGADLSIIGGWLSSPPFAFIAAKGRGIKTIKDLEGKTISVREPDGIDARFVRQVFRREGLNADQMVKWIHKGSLSRRLQQPFLDSGESDAVMIIQRDAPGMIEDGYPLLADLSKIYPDGYAVRVVAARGDVVRDEPERLTGFLRALIRGYRFMNQRYDETLALLRKAGYELDKDMDKSLWEGRYHMFERVPQDGAVGEAGLRAVIEEEKAAGLVPETFAIENILVDRLVKQAVASVNKRFGTGCE